MRSLETRCTEGIRRSCKAYKHPLNLFTIHAQEMSAHYIQTRKTPCVEYWSEFCIEFTFQVCTYSFEKEALLIRIKK